MLAAFVWRVIPRELRSEVRSLVRRPRIEDTAGEVGAAEVRLARAIAKRAANVRILIECCKVEWIRIEEGGDDCNTDSSRTHNLLITWRLSDDLRDIAPWSRQKYLSITYTRIRVGAWSWSKVCPMQALRPRAKFERGLLERCCWTCSGMTGEICWAVLSDLRVGINERYKIKVWHPREENETARYEEL